MPSAVQDLLDAAEEDMEAEEMADSINGNDVGRFACCALQWHGDACFAPLAPQRHNSFDVSECDAMLDTQVTCTT